MRCGATVLCDGPVTIELGGIDAGGLGDAVRALREWQHEGAPMQLHPGDLGWHARFGPAATAAAVRTWRRGDRIVAVGMLDGPDLLRMTISPDALQDDELSRRIAEDLSGCDVLPAGKAYVEAPKTALLQTRLAEAGWDTDEPWTPLRYDLAEPVPDPGVRIEVAGPEQAPVRVAVHRASFERSKFTTEAWHLMAAAAPYSDARCLIAYDATDTAVAAVTVWSAGAGRPGLLEPMGVHHDHRGHGYGRAICLGAAGALRAMGSSSALVCTPSRNVAAVATYASAGYVPMPEVRDRRRDA